MAELTKTDATRLRETVRKTEERERIAKNMNKDVTNDATRRFIVDHREENVRRLAFMQPDGVDMTFALNQIQGWQTALKKLPSWAAVEGIVYPPHLNMEQCSSERTAGYKRDIMRELLDRTEGETTLVDLTGGFGVDVSFLSQVVGHAVYVERNADLCKIAAHNFDRLEIENVEVKNADSIEILGSLYHVNIIYMDPARRDSYGRKMISIHDCEPDVCGLYETLLERCDWLFLKLSPMLDWHEALSELPHVARVVIVSVGNECKELLLCCSSAFGGTTQLCCLTDYGRLEFPVGGHRQSVVPIADDVSGFLYEPDAAVMKSGLFPQLAERYGVKAVGTNSHLFVSDTLIRDFPGRRFQILSISTLNKKEMRTLLTGITQANVAVRNFPLTAVELRKRLKLKDGGDTYLFGTTAGGGSRLLIITKKAV